MLRRYLLALFLLPFLCSAMEFTFPKGAGGWVGDFTDYPVDEERFYELSWGWEDLPAPTQTSSGTLAEKGLFLSGNNHSDDLFMFVRKQIGGLQPNTLYALNISTIIETNVASQSVGIGGSPGESVYIKAGASAEEPKKVAIDGFYHLSVDKGNQSIGGKNASVIGNLAHEEVDPNNPRYLPKELSTSRSLLVKSDSQGRIWVFLGSDSGFEGATKFYIAEVIINYSIAK